MEKFVAAALIMIAAVVIAPSFAQQNLFNVPESFEDTYTDTWAENGTLTDLTEEGDYIIADQGTSGTFLSDIENKGTLLGLNSIEVEADLTQAGDTSTIEVWTVKEGATVQSQNFTLEEGQNYYNLDQINETAEGYQFQINVAENEQINLVDITGQTSNADGLSETLGMFILFIMFLVGFLVATN